MALVALTSLVGCIKEESLTLQNLSIDVNLTRSGSSSDEQGDKIKEVHIWAFPVSGSQPAEEPAGWRRSTFEGDIYTSVSVHLDLPMCGNDGADYLLVALVNPEQFGKITYNGSELTLDGNTKYSQLIGARFANVSGSSPILGSVVDGQPGEPDLMPVSHWTPISVTSGDLHSASQHKVVEMSVFRAVAKTQFMVARTSQFDLKVLGVKLHNKMMPTEGMVLSPLSRLQLEAENSTPEWFGGATPAVATSDAQKVYDLAISSSGVAVNKTLAQHSDDEADYTLVGGCTIAESAEYCAYVNNAKQAPADADDGGYYYQIEYQIGSSEPLTRYVAIPYAVVRNHDYQVCALINGEGGMNVSYTVADWKDKSWTLDFSPANNTNLLAKPDVNATAEAKPMVKYNANEDQATPFKGYFRMSGPVEAEWRPVIYDAAENDYKIEVFEVTNPANITLAASPSALPIKVTAENKDKFFEVRITPKNSALYGHTFKLAISHSSPWHKDDAKLLLINAGSSSTSTYWPQSGAHHTYIEIQQTN